MAIDVLVTGAAGVLGQRVVSKLRQREYRVVGSHRIPADGIDSVWDISEREAPDPEYEARTVVHAAACVGRYQESLSTATTLLDVNAIGTLRVANWCVSRKVKRLILVSGAIVYGEWTASPKIETDPVKPWAAGPYAVSKWCSEQVAHLVEGSGCELTILRVSSLYGPGYESGLIQRMLRQGRQEGRIRLQPPLDDAFDLLHAEDAALTVCQTVTRECQGIYNIGGGAPTTLHDLARTCASEVNAQVIVAESSVARLGRVINWVDDRKARSELGHENLYSLESGIAEIARGLA